MNFSELGLSEDVLRAVADAGYTEPTAIQEQAIPWVLAGRDVLGLARTGTGKTAGFTLPMIDILAAGRAKARMPRSLILEPTRELAMQVAENFRIYGKHHKLNAALLIGGESVAEQQKKLQRGVDVLIATPGRLIDLFERGSILMSDVRILVIDESDRMLDMGFIPDIERIVKLLPPIRQTLFFSATFPPEIRRLADVFLINPKEVSVAPPASTSETVDDFVVNVSPRDKQKALMALLRSEDVRNALIFCNRKRDVDTLFRSLKKHGFNTAALHGDMHQGVRTRTLDEFREGKISLLVCSDVAARGLDIADLSHVFNYDVPMHAEDYVHRIGRTARAGQRGRAFTLATGEDRRYLSSIHSLIGREITRLEIDGIRAAESDDAEEAPPAGARGRQRGGRAEGRGRRRGGRKTAGESTPDQAATKSGEDSQPAPRAAKDREDGAKGEDGGDGKGSGSRRKRSGRRGRGGGDKSRKQPARAPESSGSLAGAPPAFLLRPVPGQGDNDGN